jgi:hypothetical protein
MSSASYRLVRASVTPFKPGFRDQLAAGRLYVDRPYRICSYLGTAQGHPGDVQRPEATAKQGCVAPSQYLARVS